MDVKGPFPETKSRHKFVLTVMDYYSKWMEAYPMKTNNSKEIAKIISDLISRFGFPVGILSCLTRAHILEVRDACMYGCKCYCTAPNKNVLGGKLSFALSYLMNIKYRGWNQNYYPIVSL